MLTTPSTALAWCLHGPFAGILDSIKSSEACGDIEWVGGARWVSEAATLTDHDEVFLCEADLCHRRGSVRPIAKGTLERFSAASDVVQISVTDITLIPDQGWERCEAGKLVLPLPVGQLALL